MEVARIFVSGVKAVVTQREPVPAGIVGATVRICYDESWEHLRKTLVFRGEVTRDVVDAGDVAVIPAETVAKPGANLLVGVYGTAQDGTLVIPTLWAEVGRIRSAADPAGDEGTEPALPVWAQILKQMGSLEQLDTEVKDNLVEAINEAAKSGVEESVIRQLVEAYLQENPAVDLTGYVRKDEIPVLSVNGETGQVVLDAGKTGADPAGTAAAAVAGHNTGTDAHNDLRLELKAISQRLNAFFDSDDQTLDELSEIVAYIKSNKTLIDSITASKVSVADIVNNLTTNTAGKPLSAAQGVALKALIDAVPVPTKVSQLTNDAGFITGYTETDPTVPDWAKAASKPSYTKSEVGLGKVDNVKQFSALYPPPYPVVSVNGEKGAVQLDAAAVGAVPTTAAITVTGVDADGVSHSWTLYGVAQ